jgi:hypothetical protein
MNLKLAGLTLSAMMVVGLVASAGAQETKPVGLSLRAGAFLPSDSSARDLANTWFAFGAELKLKDLHFGEMQPGYSSSLSLSLDYYNKDDYRHTPVLVNYIGRVDQFYYTGGIGVGFTSVPTLTGSESSTDLAYSLGVGYDFQHSKLPVFAEARYFGSSKSELNGFAFYLGVRL